MSHETSSWTVEQNRLREKQAQADAWQQVGKCEGEAEAFKRKVAAAKSQHGSALTGLRQHDLQRPASAATSTAILNYVRDLKSYLSESRKQLSSATNALDLGNRLARLAPVESGKAMPVQADKIDERRKTAARVLASLPGDLSVSARQTINALAERLVQQADSNHAANAELALRASVQRAQEDSQQRERDRAEAVNWVGKLSGLDGPDIEWARTELAKIESGSATLTSSLIHRLTQIEVDARGRLDRQYTTQVIKQTFVDLGYSVEAAFETAFIEGGATKLEHPDFGEYSVELEVDPSDNQFHAHVVREAVDGLDPDGAAGHRSRRDGEHEAKLCAHSREARRKMKDHGVRVTMTERLPPGTAGAVKVVARKERVRAKPAVQEQSAPIKR